jgi:uncharacterized protein
MLVGLIFSALLLGLAGGLHCMAMCGGVCTALSQGSRHQTRAIDSTILGLHAGRVLAYCGLGALVGTLVQSMAWMSEHMAWLKPLWVVLHSGILVWGLMLLLLARQPQWVARATQPVWQKIAWASQSAWRSTVLGTGWAVLPCGLLYSALLLASLAGGAWQGALVMFAFSIPTAIWLLGMHGLLKSQLMRRLAGYEAWSRRLTGLMLSLGAAGALWLHMVHGIQALC